MKAMTDSIWKNKLWFGDNLEVLRDRDNFPNDSIDLIYLDPPFNSNANYNMLFKEATGEISHSQTEAFAASCLIIKKAPHKKRGLDIKITTFVLNMLEIYMLCILLALQVPRL